MTPVIITSNSAGSKPMARNASATSGGFHRTIQRAFERGVERAEVQLLFARLDRHKVQAHHKPAVGMEEMVSCRNFGVVGF